MAVSGNAIEHDLDAGGLEPISCIEIASLDRIGRTHGGGPEARTPGDTALHALLQLASISERCIRLQTLFADSGIDVGRDAVREHFSHRPFQSLSVLLRGSRRRDPLHEAARTLS